MVLRLALCRAARSVWKKHTQLANADAVCAKARTWQEPGTWAWLVRRIKVFTTCIGYLMRHGTSADAPSCRIPTPSPSQVDTRRSPCPALVACLTQDLETTALLRRAAQYIKRRRNTGRVSSSGVVSASSQVLSRSDLIRLAHLLPFADEKVIYLSYPTCQAKHRSKSPRSKFPRYSSSRWYEELPRLC